MPIVRVPANGHQDFSTGTIQGNVQLANTNNVQGTITYRIGTARPVVVPMEVNEDDITLAVNGLAFAVDNNLPGTLTVAY